ncbi:MAG: hypothetical protein CO186_04105 [Zetaproteobacteria bacterium CG_4_9_14_3_um_filter_49_83]|nr:MAG: hypothetical protein AUJ56_03420 [Zetaproteobacteria bacterium CG1_02_49_23]PIQ33052.1 MAG: hypothetical protein COW62_06245 [Zetaproteobacteria bacterium CG17_big_fil_post_rev_8_21_14_2_50_50_13]PIY56327.1 MAG: hypothetical protein COZ00_04665 [Zetaproteobacteria bacterium CG_4_10_14_0_8_um_filter_49_80]PJA35752.1 MAG: hypothetical protein CO186_04105 [Zetaproteobacteria bacterium CG_4_9_14_3_um_filter_49_83]
MSHNNDELDRLQAEVTRQEKVIHVLMDFAERSLSIQNSDFSLLQSTVILEEQVRHRTIELESALHKNEQVTRALRESEAKFQQLVEHTMVGITLADSLLFYYVNTMFCHITGYSEKELLQMNPLDLVSPSHRAEFAEVIRKGMAGEITKADLQTEVVRKDGTTIWIQVTGGLPVSYNDKTVLINSSIDITERLRADKEILSLNIQLKEQAIHDPLTGLYNRRYLDEVLPREFKRAERNKGKLSLIMCDLDYFKRVNDDYGHQAGDEVLRTFASLLNSHTRASDICCRFGGEEFLLLMFDIDEDDVLSRIEHLRLSVQKKKIIFEGQTLRVTASFGVASFPDGVTTPEALLAQSDIALYKAKESGRNQVSLA